MQAILSVYKFISKGVDEGEYANAGITENLQGLAAGSQLRRSVQGTAEKGLGAAGPTGLIPSKLSRVASVIGLESSGGSVADSPRSSSRGDGEVGWHHEGQSLSSRRTKA